MTETTMPSQNADLVFRTMGSLLTQQPSSTVARLSAATNLSINDTEAALAELHAVGRVRQNEYGEWFIRFDPGPR
jgi:hypothetical protein